MGLAGCGFVPIYGREEGFRGQIAFETDRTVAGFHLQEHLEDRLGRFGVCSYGHCTLKPAGGGDYGWGRYVTVEYRGISKLVLGEFRQWNAD